VHKAKLDLGILKVSPDSTFKMRLSSPWMNPGASRRDLVIEEARRLGFKNLYLVTRDQEEFYQSLGWTKLNQVGEDSAKASMAVMSFPLD
jgi:hypothetical protein